MPGVFTFDLFSETACDTLLAELENYERVAVERGWCVSRPNSMNNHGMILNDVGLEPWIDVLQADVIGPIAAELFPVVGAELTSHHTFLVAYEPGGDRGLDMHTDDSDITTNLCLGKDFTGGSMAFCGRLGAPDHRLLQYKYEHKKGRCVMHLGRHRHGAGDITDGRRRNLIVWSSNSCFRSTSGYAKGRFPFYLGYQHEDMTPDEVCVSRTHDRDARTILGAAAVLAGAMPWCPPTGFEFR